MILCVIVQQLTKFQHSTLRCPVKAELLVHRCEYNLRSHNMKHPMSAAKDNTVLCLLFYKHVQLCQNCSNVDCCLCHTRRQDVYCSYWKLCSATISTSQHLNSSFQNFYSQFALPCEFLDCWTQYTATAKLCPWWMPFSLPDITGCNIMTTNLT